MNKRKRSTSSSCGDQFRAAKGSRTDDDDAFEQTQRLNGSDFDITDEEYRERNGWARDPGVIEYIKMTNFMCHAKFDYEPIRRINFITGVNGSGKSAVMSALIFALGGNAKMTNRGTSNKSFIRSGETQASVEIALVNAGENAYRKVIMSHF